MMIRIVLLMLCMVAASMASVGDSSKMSPKKRHTVRDFIYPYFEFSVGGILSASDYETESEKHYYHDLERDEMVYDKNLSYDIYSSRGGGPALDFRIGAILVKRVALFLDLGCFWLKGKYRYKYYSLDENEFSDKEIRFRFFWGAGFRVYPVANELSSLHGAFVGMSFDVVELAGDRDAWKKYGMTYSPWEKRFQFELGKVWKVSDYYSVGLEMNFGASLSAGVSSNTGSSDPKIIVGQPPRRDDDISFNSRHIGAAITIVRK